MIDFLLSRRYGPAVLSELPDGLPHIQNWEEFEIKVDEICLKEK